jgi:GntR family transcriptional repressor for pyruvate dehydrogenase complex
VVSVPQNKVYIETIKQIHNIILTDSLETGDKIPSERELSERLKVGRSSVREALRALELLGLIETRRGEGTFVKDFGGHHLVELIGSFILQNGKTKDDLVETKLLIEEQALQVTCKRITEEQIHSLKRIVAEKQENFEEEFFKVILISTNNRLLLKIWLLLSEYHMASFKKIKSNETEIYNEIIHSLEQRDTEKALNYFRSMNE